MGALGPLPPMAVNVSAESSSWRYAANCGAAGVPYAEPVALRRQKWEREEVPPSHHLPFKPYPFNACIRIKYRARTSISRLTPSPAFSAPIVVTCAVCGMMLSAKWQVPSA